MAKANAIDKFVKRRSKTATTLPTSKGNGETIGVTLRLDPDDWKTLRNFATDNRTSIQQIALRGCALILDREAGLKLKAVSE